MNILEIVKKVNNKHLAFDKHPANNLELERKIHYLNGLALLMNVDEEIHEKEKDYLATLLYSFELPEEKLNEFIAFAKNPDEKAVLEMMKSFSNDTIKYVFIMDCIFLAYKDGTLKDAEKELIYEYGRMFKIMIEDIGRLFHLFQKIKKRSVQNISSIKLNRGTVDVSIFQYLFDYYEMNPQLKTHKTKKKK